MSAITDFENMMALDCPIKSSAVTRWERKANQTNSNTDRFITNRAGMDNNMENLDTNNIIPAELTKHAKLLIDEHNTSNSRVLRFKSQAPAPTDGFQNSLKVLYSTQNAKREVVKTNRHISTAPFKILDAPDLVDDYCKSIILNDYCRGL